MALDIPIRERHDGALPGGNVPAAGVIARRISWGAVFAGALVALVVQLALSLLGLGIGMGTVDPLEEANSTASPGCSSPVPPRPSVPGWLRPKTLWWPGGYEIKVVSRQS